MDTDDWICRNTMDCSSVVEFGAGDFYRLGKVHSGVSRKIGIEIYEPYIVRPRFYECERILGDIRNFESLIRSEHMDCALLVDIIEHLEISEGKALMRKIMNRFKKVLLSVPEGNHPQDASADGNIWQTHLSVWRVPDVAELGFTDIVLDENHHNQIGKDKGCIFAVWRSHDEHI